MGFSAPSLVPEHFEIFTGFYVPSTMITLWIVSAIVVVAVMLFYFVYLKKFTPKPRGLQNVLEIGVGAALNLSKSKLFEKGGTIAAYITTLAIVIVLPGLTELLSFRAVETDVNFTAALALITFVLVLAYGIRYRGAGGYLKTFLGPNKAISFIYLPVKILTTVAIPISLACRLFGNMFAGLVIMELVYFAMGYFAVVVPAFLSIYFNLFHIGMQAFVFMSLTLVFISESVEE